MAHPYAGSVDSRHERAHKMIERTGHKLARGGRAHPDSAEDAAMIRAALAEHEAHDHPGKPKTKLKFAAGGAIEGEHARKHMGKRARGGHTGKGGKHVTNVIVAPQGGGAGGGGMRPPMPPPQAMQPPPPRPAAPPPPPPPPQGGMPPGAGGPPMGMRPPGAMKRGGSVRKRRAEGGPANDGPDNNIHGDPGIGGYDQQTRITTDPQTGKETSSVEGPRQPMRTEPISKEEFEKNRGGHVGRSQRARGGRTQRVQEAGVPSESLMQANKGGHVRRRDVGGSAGVPSNPTQMNPQQVQQIAQMRKQQALARQAQQQAQQGGARPPMQGPMGAAPAARMAGNPAVPMQKRGGEVHVQEHVRRARGGHVSMEAGAGGGEGRIEKTHEYGSGRGFKPKERPLHA